MIKKIVICLLVACVCPVSSYSDIGDGPYSHWYGDKSPGAVDQGIPGFVGPDGDGKVTDQNYVNPLFTGWASGYENYLPSPGVGDAWKNPDKALDEMAGDHFDVVALGDLSQDQIDDWLLDPASGDAPGEITLTFSDPITNGSGADFAVFENGLEALSSGLFFAELAYVEVSTNGEGFARFKSDYSAAAGPVGFYGHIDTTYVYNLAGKHINGYNDCWGTPFDLDTLKDDSLVMSGTVDLNDIRYVRLVDIPGSGDFTDSSGNPIFDAWLTRDSGGFDLEAVGVIHALETSQPTGNEPPTIGDSGSSSGSGGCFVHSLF